MQVLPSVVCAPSYIATMRRILLDENASAWACGWPGCRRGDVGDRSFATVRPVADHFRSSPNVGHNQIISLLVTRVETGGSNRGNLPLPQGHQMAPFVRVTRHLRTFLAPHVPLKLVDRCRLRLRTTSSATVWCQSQPRTPHFERKVTGVQRVTQCRRRLRRSTEAKHGLVPSLTCEPIVLLGALRRSTNGCAVNRLAGFGVTL
jgi:hypothetical protein